MRLSRVHFKWFRLSGLVKECATSYKVNVYNRKKSARGMRESDTNDAKNKANVSDQNGLGC